MSRTHRAMRQLPLFASVPPASAVRGPLDAESERLLQVFEAERKNQGASLRSVLREISQLRSIARECGSPTRPLPLTATFADVTLVARALLEPRVSISRSTGSTRLVAAQRFVRIVGPELGRIAEVDLATLDSLLPARSTSTWNAVGTLVGGEHGRRRRVGPTLDAVDLHRILDAAAGDQHGERAARNRALVALHCFSGLRPEEIVTQQWEDLEERLTGAGYYGLTASVERGGHRLRLPLLGPTEGAFAALQGAFVVAGKALSGHVFRTGRWSDRRLSYRAARDVVAAACRRAGFPSVASVELRAGCAHWLRTRGLSEHEVAAVLGLVRVRSVDRLLARHAALDAQRRVREHLAD